MYGRRHLPHACNRHRVTQACSLGLQRDDGFLECYTRLGIQEVGIPSIGTGPEVIILACRELAAPVLGQEHMPTFPAVTLPKATTGRSASRRTPGGPGRSGRSGLAADPQRVAPAAAVSAAPLGPWRLSAAPVSAGHGSRRRQRDQYTSVLLSRQTVTSVAGALGGHQSLGAVRLGSCTHAPRAA